VDDEECDQRDCARTPHAERTVGAASGRLRLDPSGTGHGCGEPDYRPVLGELQDREHRGEHHLRGDVLSEDVGLDGADPGPCAQHGHGPKQTSADPTPLPGIDHLDGQLRAAVVDADQPGDADGPRAGERGDSEVGPPVYGREVSCRRPAWKRW
jgi:hypothetical protein